MIPVRIGKCGARGLAVALICFATLTLSAQTEHRFTFEVGGGFAPFAGGFANRVGHGWHGDVGAGWNLTRLFSLGAKSSYSGGFGISPEVLLNASARAGNMHVWSLTAEPRLQLGVHRHVSPFLVGGVGYYRRVLHFTPRPLPPVFFIPGGPSPSGTDEFLGILGDGAHAGLGGNLGGGLSFPLHGNLSVFSEARYHYAHTGGSSVVMQMVPVTFGIRF